jgi:hypothetical protein
MKKLKIMVVCGGVGGEKEVSKASGKKICDKLDANKYQILKFEIKQEQDYFGVVEKCRQKNVDLIFNALHGEWGENGVRTFLRNTGRADPRQINVLQVVRALAAGKGHGEQTKMLKGVLVKPGGGFPLYKYADDRNLNAPGSEALREIARQKKMERVSASQVIPGERVLMEKRRASLLALKQKKAVGLTREERDHLQRLQKEMKSVDSKEVSAPTPSFVKRARATPIPYGGL